MLHTGGAQLDVALLEHHGVVCVVGAARCALRKQERQQQLRSHPLQDVVDDDDANMESSDEVAPRGVNQNGKPALSKLWRAAVGLVLFASG